MRDGLDMNIEFEAREEGFNVSVDAADAMCVSEAKTDIPCSTGIASFKESGKEADICRATMQGMDCMNNDRAIKYKRRATATAEETGDSNAKGPIVPLEEGTPVESGSIGKETKKRIKLSAPCNQRYRYHG